MPRSRRQHDVRGLRAQRLQIGKRRIHRRGYREDAPVGRDTQERASHQIDDREGRTRRDCLIEPRPGGVKIGVVVAVGRQHHIDVEQLQRSSAIPPAPRSSTSRNALFDRRSTPGNGPSPPRNTGTATGSAGACSASSRRSARAECRAITSLTLRRGGTASRRDKRGERARPDWPPQALVESVILVHEGVTLVG